MEIMIISIVMSLPELILCICGGLCQNSEVVTGIIVGCMLFHILGMAGICGMLCPIKLNQNIITQQLPLMIFCEIVVVYLGADYLLHGIHSNCTISRTDGIILLLLFFFFLWLERKNISTNLITDYLYQGEKKEGNNIAKEIKSCSGKLSKKTSWRRWGLAVLIGIVFLFFFSEMILSEEKKICSFLDVSETVFEMLMVTMVVCLPKLAVVLAMRKKKSEIMEIIARSNGIDCLLAMGLGATLSPISLSMEQVYPFILLCVFSIMVWAFAIYRREVGRLQGCIMVTCYVSYMVYICIR